MLLLFFFIGEISPDLFESHSIVVGITVPLLSILIWIGILMFFRKFILFHGLKKGSSAIIIDKKSSRFCRIGEVVGCYRDDCCLYIKFTDVDADEFSVFDVRPVTEPEEFLYNVNGSACLLEADDDRN
jgi:hypothetical protein